MKTVIRRSAVLLAALGLAACTPTTPPSGTPTPSPTSATATASPTGTASPTAATLTVEVFFDNRVENPGAADCSAVFPVERQVPATADTAAAALEELLAGPAPEEAAAGYSSWFSAATAGALLGVRVQGNTAYVNLSDLRQVIPNAGTSCGSAQFMASLDTTVTNATGAGRVLYAFDGDPAAFWDFVQVGCGSFNDDCDPAPFVGLTP